MMYKYTDIFLSTGIYMWFQLEENGEDLTLIGMTDYSENSDAISDVPDVLAEEMTESGWDSILNVSFTTDASGLGWVFDTTWTTWALHNGIAPYQPFCIKMEGLPEYYTTGDGECDVDFAPWKIVEKEQWSTFETSRHWEHWFMMRTRYREMARYQMRRLLHLRKYDLNAMYLSSNVYWSRGADYDYFPNGLRVSLCTRHISVEGFSKCTWHALANGEADRGNYKVALNRLIENARVELPHLSEEFIRGLHKRNIL